MRLILSKQTVDNPGVILDHVQQRGVFGALHRTEIALDHSGRLRYGFVEQDAFGNPSPKLRMAC